MAGYKCSRGMCYAVADPAVDGSIKTLQSVINRFSKDPDIEFTPIAVDGIFGKGTLAALFYALTIVDLRSAGGGPVGYNSDADYYIKSINAPDDAMDKLSQITTYLAQAADILNEPTGVIPSTNPPTKIPAVATKSPAGQAALLALKSQNKSAMSASILDVFTNLPTWAKVAGGLFAVGGVVFFATSSASKKRKSAAHQG